MGEVLDFPVLNTPPELTFKEMEEEPSMWESHKDRKEKLTGREEAIYAIRKYIGPGIKVTTPNDQLDYIASLTGKAQRIALLTAIISQLMQHNIKKDLQSSLSKEIENLKFSSLSPYGIPVDNYSDYMNFNDVENMNYKMLGINVKDSDYVAKLSSKIEDYKLEIAEKQKLLAEVNKKDKKDLKTSLKKGKLIAMDKAGTLVLTKMEEEKQKTINAQLDAIAFCMNPVYKQKDLLEKLKVKASDMKLIPKNPVSSFGAPTVHTQTETRTTVTVTMVPEVTGRKFKK